MLGRGIKNVDLLECELNDYQFKTSSHSYRSTYMNPMGTTNQKPTIDTQKLERKEHRHTTKEDIKPQRKKQKEE